MGLVLALAVVAPAASSKAVPAAIVPVLTGFEWWELTGYMQEHPPVVGCAALETSSGDDA